MLKLNLNSLVKPKVFWPTISILLITSIIIYAIKEKEKTIRIFTQKQLTQTIEEKRVVENKLEETGKEKEQVGKALTFEKERSSTLEKELGEKEQEIKITLDRLEKEIITRREVEARLITAVKERMILEAKLKDFPEVHKTIELQKIVIKPSSELRGRLLAVNKEYAFVVINLGKENNISVGDTLSIYRNDEFIGKVQVEKIDENISAATILPEYKDLEFKEDDVAKKI